MIIYQSIDDSYDDDGNNSDDYVDGLLWWIELLRKVCLPFYKLRRCQILSLITNPKICENLKKILISSFT